MSYRQGNMEIDDLGDGKARVTVTDIPSGRHLFAEVFRNNREKAAQALAGDDSKVVTASSSDPERRIRVVGECPSCKNPRLVLNEFGYVVCENIQCAIPAAVGETLIDPNLRCRCGKLRSDDSPECEWHDSRTEREHLGWVIVRATEAAMLHSDQDAVADLTVTVNELIEELRLSVEYVGIDVLQPYPGWGWYDALKKHMPQFDEWLAKMPSRGTAHLAAELNGDDHGDIDQVLETLYFTRGLVENIENSDEEHEVTAHIEQLSRIINACDRVRRDPLPHHTAPPVDEGADDSAMLGVVSPIGGTMYPHIDGDYVVLGPEIFTNDAGTVINWRGENYYPRPMYPPRREDEVEEQTRRYAAAFKMAWHAADGRGEIGQRTMHGIHAVVDLWYDAMTGQRVDVSEVEPGDYVLAYFADRQAGPFSEYDESDDVTPRQYFSVEGYTFTTGVGETLYVGGNRLRTDDGSRSKDLGEIRLLERSTTGLDQDEIDAVRQALRDARDDELGDHFDELKVATALVRRNVKKVSNDR